MKLLLVISAVLAVATRARMPLEDMEFHAWKLKFSKSYSSPAEKAWRKEIWLDNLQMVLAHNILADQGMKSYRMGMTEFADLQTEEYQQLISQGCLGHFNASRTQQGSTFFRLLDGIKLPPSVDWRDKGYVTPVKDQKQCGSCWAFSTTGSLEGQHFRKTSRLVSLSEQQLLDCSGSHGNDGCNGGLVNKAFKYIQDNGGLDTEESYPYEAKDGRCRFKSENVGAKCTGYVDVTRYDEDALKEAVATVGPVSIAIDASHLSFQLYSSGVYDEPRCSRKKLNHAVVIVGYGSDGGNDYWLVKNSWGVNWGDRGYIKMSRNKNNQCGIATEASYPLVNGCGIPEQKGKALVKLLISAVLIYRNVLF